jgi:hypothetical protein
MVRNSPIEPVKHESAEKVQPKQAPAPAMASAPAPAPGYTLEPNVELWVNEQMFEEDVRAVLRMMRPNSRERLQGWKEYRTGGAHYRVTISWDDEFQISSKDTLLAVPHMPDVIETLLLGSARNQDELDAGDEFEIYRQVVREVYNRLDEREACCK